MNPKPLFRPLLMMALSLFSSSGGWAHISNDVPARLPNVEWVDRIEAWGCAVTSFRAFQPISHGDLLEALIPYANTECQAPDWLLKEREILGRSILQSEATGFITLGNSGPLALLAQAAVIDPYFPLREGRRVFGGPSIYGEFNLNSESGKDFGLAVSATPGLVFGFPQDQGGLGRFYFQEGYIKVGYRRTELVFGRISERFGEAKHGNLILSGAGKPIDMVKFAVRPHWIKPISFMGPLSFETWMGTDSSQVGFTNAKLWAMELGFRPFTFFEFGFLNLMQFGGVGSPSLSLGDYFSLLAMSNSPDLRVKRHQSYSTHLAFWGPESIFKLYGQVFFGNLGRVENWFSEDISWLVGIWLPKIQEGDIRLEYVKTTANAYSHSLWTQGWTNAGTPLGHPLGGDAEGIYLDFGFSPWAGFRPELELSYEMRNKDLLLGPTSETRYHLLLGVTHRWVATELTVQAKIQTIQNWDYFPSSQKVTQGGMYLALRYSFL